MRLTMRRSPAYHPWRWWAVHYRPYDVPWCIFALGPVWVEATW